MVIKLLIPFVILALMIGVARLFFDLRAVFGSPTVHAGFDLMVTNLLSMFVVIELLRSIIEYFEVHRLKITFIIDAALVFFLREVMIAVYRHAMGVREVVALAALILVLGILRTLAIIYSPDKAKEKLSHE
ncbi:MAG: phosphate-starvation-inducible PsiE family protein [Nitrospirota bacterium]